MKERKHKPRNNTWSITDIEFLIEWYGKITAPQIGEILGKTKKSVQGAVRQNEIKLQTPLFGMIEIVYKGEVYTIKGRRYTKVQTKSGNYRWADTQYKKESKVKMKTKKNPSKPAKTNNQVQVSKVREFVPPIGKTLVQVDKKTWAYR